jgi:hypothetical protein
MVLWWFQGIPRQWCFHSLKQYRFNGVLMVSSSLLHQLCFGGFKQYRALCFVGVKQCCGSGALSVSFSAASMVLWWSRSVLRQWLSFWCEAVPREWCFAGVKHCDINYALVV